MTEIATRGSLLATRKWPPEPFQPEFNLDSTWIQPKFNLPGARFWSQICGPAILKKRAGAAARAPFGPSGRLTGRPKPSWAVSLRFHSGFTQVSLRFHSGFTSVAAASRQPARPRNARCLISRIQTEAQETLWVAFPQPTGGNYAQPEVFDTDFGSSTLMPRMQEIALRLQRERRPATSETAGSRSLSKCAAARFFGSECNWLDQPLAAVSRQRAPKGPARRATRAATEAQNRPPGAPERARARASERATKKTQFFVK
jgi:hypothetical protein